MSHGTFLFSLRLPAWCLVLVIAPAPPQPDAPRVPLVDKPRSFEMPPEYGFFNNARSCAFSPDGRILVFSDPKYRLVIWDVQACKESQRLPPGSAHYAGIQSFSGDGKTLAVLKENGRLQLLDTATWRAIKELNLQKVTKTSWNCGLSHDGKLVAVATVDNKPLLWNLAKDTKQLLEGHTTQLRCCAVSPDGRLVISGSGEQGSLDRPTFYPAELKFWDAATGKEIFSGSGSQGMIYKVIFSPDSKLIAVQADDGTVRVWDVVLRRELLTLKDPKRDSLLQAVAFSPDGKWILTAGWHSEIQVWNASTGRLEKTVSVGIRIVTSASFSPDGQKVLMTSKDDKKMRLLMLTGDAK